MKSNDLLRVRIKFVFLRSILFNLKKIVIITGGPGFGKTSLVNALGSVGYRVGSEAARELIDEQLASGGDIVPWKNLKAFQQEVLRRRLAFFHAVGAGEFAFSDRGIPDQLAFARYRGFQNPVVLVENAKKYRYFPVVFVVPPWKEIYRKDEIRTESFEEACQMHEMIIQTYHELEYQLVELPLATVPERVEFIQQYLTKQNDEFIKKKIF
jgi:predicted ATPase